MSTDVEPKKESPINAQFTALYDNISKLHELLQSLGVRLEPVILTCPATKGEDADKPTGSPLLEKLISITNSVWSANQKIEGILSTLQI